MLLLRAWLAIVSRLTELIGKPCPNLENRHPLRPSVSVAATDFDASGRSDCSQGYGSHAPKCGDTLAPMLGRHLIA
jgi:hypothetical protein